MEADKIERLLDAALEQTFPASDPIAIDVPSRKPPADLEQMRLARHAVRLPA